MAEIDWIHSNVTSNKPGPNDSLHGAKDGLVVIGLHLGRAPFIATQTITASRFWTCGATD